MAGREPPRASNTNQALSQVSILAQRLTQP